MKAIKKFQLNMKDQVLRAPLDFTPLSVAFQVVPQRIQSVQKSVGLFLWAIIDTDADEVGHEILVRGTGAPMDDAAPGVTYVGTGYHFDSPVVSHVFYAGIKGEGQS